MLNKITTKIITLLLVTIICLNHVFPCICYADGSTSDELKAAINSFNALLDAKREEIQKVADAYGLDETTKKMAIQQYYENALRGKAWPTFDDEAINIAYSISNYIDRQTFYANLSEYVENYVKESVYKGGEKNDTETAQAASLDYKIDNVAGILLVISRLLLAVVPAAIVQIIDLLMVRIGSNEQLTLTTLDAIIFNKVPVTDANIFKYEVGKQTNLEENHNVLYDLRQAISGWYVAIRNLCLALSLAVLVYIGVRMAISSIADDKAKYKKMLKDWLVSVALIFTLHYIMVGILNVNDKLVDILYDAKLQQESQVDIQTQIYMYMASIVDGTKKIETNDAGATRIVEANGDALKSESIEYKLLRESVKFDQAFTKGLLATAMYFMINVMTFLFIIVYIKRLITISILTMIAPIITVTYSIDKAGDGKAQALNKWLKEYAFNVLIQPFHCIIYLVVVQNIYYIVIQSGGLQFGKALIAIMMFGFMYKAEDIVKSIFGFETASLGSAAVIGAAALSRAQKTVGTASNFAKLGNLKGAGAKANQIKQVNKNTPKDLPTKSVPGQAGNAAASAAAKPTAGGGTNAKQLNARQKLGKAAWAAGKFALKQNANAAKYIASHTVARAIGYGLTGDYKAAETAASLQKTTKGAIDNARLKHQYNKAKDNMLDAHEQYRQNHQEMTDEQIRDKEKELLGKDISEITDSEERNLAEHLKAYEQTQAILGQKDSAKAVMNDLKEYDEEG